MLVASALPISLRSPAAWRATSLPPPVPRQTGEAAVEDLYSGYVGGGKPPGSPNPLAGTGHAQERLHLSPLWNSLLGTLAVGISKTGFGIEWVGKKLGLIEHLGQIQKPLPPSRLTELPFYKLERPLVLVPGFQTPKNRFEHLVDKLTADGRNGGVAYYVRDGKFFSDIECTTQMRAPGPEARVFVAVFHSTQDIPSESAPQLDQDLKAIRQFTGASRVDAAGYSMGGLATRYYLDQGGNDIGRFTMVGTPNQGSALSQLSLFLLDQKEQGRGVDWLLSRKPLSEADRPALEWLRPVDSVRPNPYLADLNSRWEQQKSHVDEVLSMGSQARLTSSDHAKPVKGDGTVPATSLELPDTEVRKTSGKVFGNHGLLLSSPEIYEGLAEFFHWSPEGAAARRGETNQHAAT